MSQVYSISLKFDYLNKDLAKKVIQQKIARGPEEHINYGLGHYKNDLDLDLDHFLDLERDHAEHGRWHRNLVEV